MPKHSHSVDAQCWSRIQERGRGWVFTPSHFSDLGSRAAVASALKRFKAAGDIRQLARGLYDYPREHPLLGRVAPSSDAIAEALAAREAIRLQPSGAYAANVLGLSEQVPSRVTFLTDGASRRVKLGAREIVLQRTTPRNMAAAGRKSGVIIQALRHLGQSRVDDQVLATLRRQITQADREQLRHDLRHAPAWVAEVLRKLDQEPTSP